MCDVATTAVILRDGGLELNPIWAPIYEHGWTPALGLQLVLAAAVVAPLRRVRRPWLRALTRVLFMGTSWFPVVWNLAAMAA